MKVIVITPPQPIVSPADIPGSHAADDPFVTAMIAAATAEIDGPTGWLGRALGPQTLELQLDGFDCNSIRLPYLPVIKVEEVRYTDASGVDQVVEGSAYELRGADLVTAWGQSWPATRDHIGAVRIRYRAGYDGISPADGGTGPLPANVKAAIILAVQHLKATGGENLFLRSESIDGVGDRQWTVSEAAGQVIERAVGNLLAPLRVYA